MVCQHGGLTFVRHNDMHDITAGLFSKVCSDVSVELPLQPLSGEVITPKTANRQDDARADIYTYMLMVSGGGEKVPFWM